MKIALIVLCFFLPPLAVFLKDGLSGKVLIALLLQVLGHVPGVIYGLLVVTRD
ncbi:YqaE/Pmp3 family membrane protein [Kineococcus gynurae]|uniref:YqaE/Pmp3 family membrane protein n=1 Tax=Kineococcus gynurae TaxID=452979 RepID=A0ABV5LSL8_9ACTN